MKILLIIDENRLECAAAYSHMWCHYIIYKIVYSTYYRICRENSGKVKVAYG